MSKNREHKDAGVPASPKSSESEISAFLRQVAAIPATAVGVGQGRLIFAMDATASRQPTWDRACQIQAEMFAETAGLGGLHVQLVFFAGSGNAGPRPGLLTRPGCRAT